MKPAKVIVTKEGFYRPHGEFLHAAEIHLTHFRQKIDGYDYSLLSGFILTAFAFEAFLNSVGPKIEKGWNDFDRASVWVKLRHVLAILRIEPDFSRDPFQSIHLLFRFRNLVAHPRDSKILTREERTVEDYQEELYSSPRPDDWKVLTEENAARFLEAVTQALQLINNSMPDPDPMLFSRGDWSGGASLVL